MSYNQYNQYPNQGPNQGYNQPPPNQYGQGGPGPNQGFQGYQQPPNQYGQGGPGPNQGFQGYNNQPPPNQYGQGGPGPNQYGQSGPNRGYNQPPPPNYNQGRPPQNYNQGGPPQNYNQGGPPQNYNQGGPPQNQFNPNVNYFSILKRAVQQNELGAFYRDDQLQQIAQSLPGKIQHISQKWQIPMQIAVDLARLALYDIILLLDDSGSMRWDEGGERIDDLKVIVGRAAYIGGMMDHNGIQVRFLNNNFKGEGLRDERSVLQMIDQIKFDGITPLGTSLKSKVLDPLVLAPAHKNALLKPVLIITVTDGEPTGENPNKVFKVIEAVKKEFLKSRYRPGAVAFEFAQVGNDMKAQAFLSRLDNDPTVGKLVDVTSGFEIEAAQCAKLGATLDPATWLVKVLLGAVDPSYDEKDEKR